MKKYRFYNTAIALGLLCFFSGCYETQNENVIDLDKVSEVELDSISSDIKVFPIKCHFPIDKIRRCFSYNDYTFLLSSSKKTVYCVYNDTVISILSAVGRGHGEYTYINDLAFSEEDKILYVNVDKGLFKYKVPSMSFIGSVDIGFTTDGMISLNPKELLVNCSYYSDDKDEKVFIGICVVSKETGQIVKKCMDLDYYNITCFMTHDLKAYQKGALLSLGGFNENKVVYLDEESGSVKEIYSFGYTSKWKTPRRLIRLQKKDFKKFDDEIYSRSVYCDGCHYPSVINSRLSFWCFPFEDERNKKVAVVINDGKAITRSFKISGTNITVNPSFVRNNYCVKLIEGPTESIITDPDELSPLGREIVRKMKSQKYNNPVFLFFTVDKGL